MNNKKPLMYNIIILIVILIIYDYTTISGTVTNNYNIALFVQRLLLIIQFVPLAILNVKIFFKANLSKYDMLYLVLSIALALNAEYITHIFSIGAYYLLQNDYQILPTMRTPAAILMLDSGQLKIIDPHYLFPSEFIIVWLLSKFTGLNVASSYIINFGMMQLTLWISISLAIFNSYKLFITNSKSYIYNFMLILSITLLIFNGPGFFFREFSIGKPLLLLILLSMINIKNKRYIINKTNLLIILLLTLGIILNSLRDTIALIMIFTISIIYLLLSNLFLSGNRSGKLRILIHTFIIVISLSMIKILYFGSLYLVGYRDYVKYLLDALLKALEIGFKFQRPPLHTIAYSDINIIDKILNLFGSIDLFLLVAMLGIISIYLMYNLLKDTHGDIDHSIFAGIYTSYILTGAVAAMAYIVNISAYFNIDFEVFFSLIPYSALMPLGFILLLKDKHINIDKHREIKIIIVFLIIFMTMFSSFGLANRVFVRSVIDIRNDPNNPDNAIIQLNQLYYFLINNYDYKILYIEHNAGYIQLYLALPLIYDGFNIINIYSCKLPYNYNNVIYSNGIFNIDLYEQKYALLCQKYAVVLPY